MSVCIPFILLAAFLTYLCIEAAAVARWQKQLPLRIAVTGTRGKSGIIRMLSAILEQDSASVFAKITGTEARFLLPGGQTVKIRRPVFPSIMEQKKTLRLAAGSGAGVLIAEIMSIQPENHAVESRQLLAPHIVVIANIRPDHTDAMGGSREEIAAVLSLVISRNAIVFLPEEDLLEPVIRAARAADSRLVPVAPGTSRPLTDARPDLKNRLFTGSLDLVYAVCSHLQVAPETMLNALARMPAGRKNEEIRVLKTGHKTIYLVNAFAANDPGSSFMVLDAIRRRLPGGPLPVLGVLSLRHDRGDRSQQWLNTLTQQHSTPFCRLFVCGLHAPVFASKLPGTCCLKKGDPVVMTKKLTDAAPDRCIIFGFGNSAGTGDTLASCWAVLGEPCDY